MGNQLSSLAEGTLVLLDGEGYRVGRSNNGYREITWVSGMTSLPGTTYNADSKTEVRVVDGLRLAMPLARFGIIEIDDHHRNGRVLGVVDTYKPKKEQGRLFEKV